MSKKKIVILIIVLVVIAGLVLLYSRYNGDENLGPCTTDDSSGCYRGCLNNSDCKCTCSCGCINIEEVCEQGNNIIDCFAGPPDAKCSLGKCESDL